MNIMKLHKWIKNKNFISILSLILFLITAIIVVFIAKGYIFNLKDRTIDKTGMLIVDSEPKGALIYIGEELKGTTNSSFSYLPPDSYQLKIEKEGYSTWTRKIAIEANIVEQIEARLFPLNPSLTPITTFGCYNPLANSEQTKIAFQISDNQEKNGVWILTFNNFPLNLSKGYELTQIIRDTAITPLSKSDMFWSPDDKHLLLSLQLDSQNTENYIIEDFSRINNSLSNSNQTKEEILNNWQSELEKIKNNKNLTLPETIQEILKNHPESIWSPDGKRFFFNNQDGFIETYDVEKTTETVTTLKTTDYQSVKWYADSQRLILLENFEADKNGKISIAEIDGQNKISVYEGILSSDRIFVSPDGNKIFFLTNFNSSLSTYPNLYSLNLE